MNKWYAVSAGSLREWWVADDGSTDTEARVSDNMSRAAAETIVLKHNAEIARLTSDLASVKAERGALAVQLIEARCPACAADGLYMLQPGEEICEWCAVRLRSIKSQGSTG